MLYERVGSISRTGVKPLHNERRPPVSPVQCSGTGRRMSTDINGVTKYITVTGEDLTAVYSQMPSVDTITHEEPRWPQAQKVTPSLVQQK